METATLRLASSLRRFIWLGCMLACAGVGTARAWWNPEWTLRKAITIDPAAMGTPAPDGGAVVVLVRLFDGNFQFTSAHDDGSDLRFVASDDKTLLPFHIERYDSLLDEAFVWVRLPAVPAGAKTTFWLYYGNGGNVAKADDPKATYDTDTALVYHFAVANQAAVDATGAGHDALDAGLPAAGAMIGGGLHLDGSHPVKLPAAPDLAWTAGGSLTVSAWVKPAASQDNAVLFSRVSGARSFVLGLNQGVPFVEVSNGGAAQRAAGGDVFAPNAWYQLAVTASGGSMTLYVNGASVATLSAGLPALDTSAVIGARDNDAAGSYAGFVGDIDELEIYRVARGAGSLRLASVSQGTDATGKFIAYGEDEQPADPWAWLKGGYFGVIVSSLTVDGWVVICLLAVMSLISWFVMFNKIGLLNAVSKGNALFLEQWEQTAEDLTELDEADDEQLKSLGGRLDNVSRRLMRNSSVYRLYHIGAEEIRHRMKRGGGDSKVLSARSIQAIRAALDGGLVRETQKINNLVVLLTICISGGPFLGLLGTVVGVMITFAAVAAAGDVNVNAIAPGIAAALLATVAGLAVAIPSLFGYNYILSRIKNATSDMTVFIDEFVTKMAEYYSDTPEKALTRAPFGPSEP